VFLAQFFDEKLLKNQNRRPIVDTPHECLQNVVNTSNVATMLSRNYVMSLGKEFLDQHKQFPLSPFKEDVLNNNIVMLLQKGSYFLDVINNIIIRLVEAGLPDKFLNYFLHTEQHHFASKAVELLNSSYITMTLSHLETAFVSLFLGICLSLFTLVIEILHSRRGRAGQRKLQEAGKFTAPKVCIT